MMVSFWSDVKSCLLYQPSNSCAKVNPVEVIVVNLNPQTESMLRVAKLSNGNKSDLTNGMKNGNTRGLAF